MSNVIAFRLRNKPDRDRVKQWLRAHYSSFPALAEDVGPMVFHGWRFVRGLDGVIYFADCISPGITENELLDCGGAVYAA